MNHTLCFDLDDFTYDSTTKKYTINFPHSRLQNVRHISFQNFHYTNSTCSSHIILVHSDICDKLKQHRYYKGSSHNKKLDVLFALKETHSPNRFVLQDKKVFDLDRGIFGFQLWFADVDGTLLSDISVVPPVIQADVTVSDITTELGDDISVFLDFDPSRVLDSNFAQKSAVGDTFFYIHSVQNVNAIFNVAYGTHVELSDFNGNGMLSFTGSSSWQSVVDNAIDIFGSANSPEADSTIITLFKLAGNAYTYLIETDMFKIFYMNGNLQFKDSQGTNTVVQLQVIPLTAYMLKIERDHNNQSFDWELTDLSTDVVQNATTVCGLDPQGNVVGLRYGFANTHFTHHQSLFFWYDNRSAARNTLIQNYCKQQFNGEVTSESQEINPAHVEELFFELQTYK